jgi:hypothetical protein
VNSKKVRLKSVHVLGFRSCRDTEFRPHADLSALIGANGAGKTSLLTSIQLLSLLARSIASPSSSHDDDANEKSAESETVLTAWFEVDGIEIGYKIHLFVALSDTSAFEVVAVADSWNIFAITGEKEWRSISMDILFEDESFAKLKYFDLYERQRYRSRRFTDANFASSPYLESNLLHDKKLKKCVRQIFDFCNHIQYYSASQFTDPSRCPVTFSVDGSGKLEDSADPLVGRPHSQFLFDLYSLQKRNPSLYLDYESFVSQERLGLISKISWTEVPLSSRIAQVMVGGRYRTIAQKKTLVIPRVQIGPSHVTFNQLSEGTFRTLAMIFYVMTDVSTCLLLEEPEVCVHHGLLRSIISTISAYSSTKQIIFSTHSDLVLDQLDPGNVFVIEQKQTGTQVSALEPWLGRAGREALSTYLADTGTLGEYWRAGGFSS